MTYKEIDEMIETVDKNGDGKISFSEFRCKVFQTKKISKKTNIFRQVNVPKKQLAMANIVTVRMLLSKRNFISRKFSLQGYGRCFS